MNKGNSSRNKIHCAVLGLYFTIILAVLAPSWVNDKICGDGESEVYVHVWNHWWFGGALKGNFKFFRMDLINYPMGGKLFPIDWVNSILYQPLIQVFSAAAAYNLIIVLQLTLGAFAAYLLAAHWRKSPSAAFPAGLIYALSPYVLAYSVGSGVGETLNLAWLPLFFLFLIRTTLALNRYDPWLGGFFFFLTYASCPYHGQQASILLAAFMLYLLLGVKKRTVDLSLCFEPAGDSGVKKWQRPVIVRLFTLVIAATIMLLPFFLILKYTITPPGAMLDERVFAPRETGEVLHEFDPSLPSRYTSYLTEFCLPGKKNIVVVDEVTKFYHTVYCGISVIMLAAVGMIWSWRSWFAKFLAFMAFFFLLISIGPYMPVNATIHLKGPYSPVYLFLFYLFPFFSRVLEPFRLILPLLLILGIFTAQAVERLAKVLPRDCGLLVTVSLVTVVIMIDFLVCSPAPYPIPSAKLEIPQAYRIVAASTRAGALLELPLWKEGTLLQPRSRFYFQMIHQRPIAETIHGFPNAFLEQNFSDSFLFPMNSGAANGAKAAIGLEQEEISKERFRFLSEAGFRYVIIDRFLISMQTGASMRELLGRILGEPVVEDERNFVFILPDKLDDENAAPG